MDHDAARLLTPYPGAMASLGSSNNGLRPRQRRRNRQGPHRSSGVHRDGKPCRVRGWLSEKAAVDRLSEKAAAV